MTLLSIEERLNEFREVYLADNFIPNKGVNKPISQKLDELTAVYKQSEFLEEYFYDSYEEFKQDRAEYAQRRKQKNKELVYGLLKIGLAVSIAGGVIYGAHCLKEYILSSPTISKYFSGIALGAILGGGWGIAPVALPHMLSDPSRDLTSDEKAAVITLFCLGATIGGTIGGVIAHYC